MSSLDALYILIIKPLYYLIFRSAVQIQLVTLVMSVLISWFLSKLAAKQLQDRFPPEKTEKLEEVILEQEFGASQVPVKHDDAKAPKPALERASVRRSLLRGISPFLFPLLSLGLVEVARIILSLQGFLVGLIDQFFTLIWLWGGYKILAVVIDARMEENRARRYRSQLLTPLFLLLISTRILAWIVDPKMLGDVVLLDFFGSPLTWGDLFLASVGLYLWVEIAWVISDILYHLMQRRATADPGTLEASLTLIRYILIVIGLLYVFSELDFNPTTLAAITTGVSAGIAFGSREILNNFVGGILLLFEQTVRPGDTVEINNTTGVVAAVNIRSTTIQAYDGREIIIPNSTVLTSSVVTYTKSSRHARIRIEVGVSYDADPKFVLELLRTIVKSHENVLDDPAPNAFLAGFGEYSVDFVVLGWVEDLSLKFMTTHDLHFMIWDAFAQHDIEMPYPKRDLHLRGTPWEKAQAPAAMDYEFEENR